MRDIKLKLKIIWLLLSDQYTSSSRESCWWLWKSDIDIKFNTEKSDDKTA